MEQKSTEAKSALRKTRTTKTTSGFDYVVNVDRKNLQNYLNSSAEFAKLGKPQKVTYVRLTKVFEERLSAEEVNEIVFVGNYIDAGNKQIADAEVDRVNRLARIVSLADRVFGNIEKSSRWLRKPRAKLSGQTPLELIATDAGTAVVEEMLHQIDHGMYA